MSWSADRVLELLLAAAVPLEEALSRRVVMSNRLGFEDLRTGNMCIIQSAFLTCLSKL